jgi:hypothetical protein
MFLLSRLFRKQETYIVFQGIRLGILKFSFSLLVASLTVWAKIAESTTKASTAYARKMGTRSYNVEGSQVSYLALTFFLPVYMIDNFFDLNLLGQYICVASIYYAYLLSKLADYNYYF